MFVTAVWSDDVVMHDAFYAPPLVYNASCIVLAGCGSTQL
jgi:hypothetical protein